MHFAIFKPQFGSPSEFGKDFKILKTVARATRFSVIATFLCYSAGHAAFVIIQQVIEKTCIFKNQTTAGET